MLFGRVLRWTCDARQLAALERARLAAQTLRAARQEADRLYDVLLGEGPNGLDNWTLRQAMISAYRKGVVPIHRHADAARCSLGYALRRCRSLELARWQVRLALM